MFIPPKCGCKIVGLIQFYESNHKGFINLTYPIKGKTICYQACNFRKQL